MRRAELAQGDLPVAVKLSGCGGLGEGGNRDKCERGYESWDHGSSGPEHNTTSRLEAPKIAGTNYKPRVARSASSTAGMSGNRPMPRCINSNSIVARLSVMTTESANRPVPRASEEAKRDVSAFKPHSGGRESAPAKSGPRCRPSPGLGPSEAAPRGRWVVASGF